MPARKAAVPASSMPVESLGGVEVADGV